jgi:hypothetical protein
MPRYVHISEGPSADEADDLVVVSDPQVVRAVFEALGRRLGLAHVQVRPLRPLPAKPEREGAP